MPPKPKQQKNKTPIQFQFQSEIRKLSFDIQFLIKKFIGIASELPFCVVFNLKLSFWRYINSNFEIYCSQKSERETKKEIKKQEKQETPEKQEKLPFEIPYHFFTVRDLLQKEFKLKIHLIPLEPYKNWSQKTFEIHEEKIRIIRAQYHFIDLLSIKQRRWLHKVTKRSLYLLCSGRMRPWFKIKDVSWLSKISKIKFLSSLIKTQKPVSIKNDPEGKINWIGIHLNFFNVETFEKNIKIFRSQRKEYTHEDYKSDYHYRKASFFHALCSGCYFVCEQFIINSIESESYLQIFYRDLVENKSLLDEFNIWIDVPALKFLYEMKLKYFTTLKENRENRKIKEKKYINEKKEKKEEIDEEDKEEKEKDQEEEENKKLNLNPFLCPTFEEMKFLKDRGADIFSCCFDSNIPIFRFWQYFYVFNEKEIIYFCKYVLFGNETWEESFDLRENVQDTELVNQFILRCVYPKSISFLEKFKSEKMPFSVSQNKVFQTFINEDFAKLEQILTQFIRNGIIYPKFYPNIWFNNEKRKLPINPVKQQTKNKEKK